MDEVVLKVVDTLQGQADSKGFLDWEENTQAQLSILDLVNILGWLDSFDSLDILEDSEMGNLEEIAECFDLLVRKQVQPGTLMDLEELDKLLDFLRKPGQAD